MISKAQPRSSSELHKDPVIRILIGAGEAPGIRGTWSSCDAVSLLSVTSLLVSLTEKSSSDDFSISNDDKFSRFMEIDKEVAELRNSLKEMKLKSDQDDEEDDSSDNQSDASDVQPTSIKLSTLN
ncbi:PREDICTED: uncharacterized protein LOC109580636 [Amphimedon queenslandica]|uniref:Uncharacterized protein n=1 Tax=Amphimedon queenslandica TaxID=400682 RepID=A0AAN0IXV6_AMPQE|nr:PREDICTED: uncharacterized protein LOC109580636 [Amphimedon queenslandica]|eukprot:XP_019849600.1 PREDICTED: uncharacterized protein LOC109580636 [Amphimedon queenslandica]